MRRITKRSIQNKESQKDVDKALDKALDKPDKADKADKADMLLIEPLSGSKKGGWAGQKAFRQSVFLDAFPKVNFNISAAAREAHIETKTFYNWMKADADFKESIEALKETKIDVVEDQLFKKCKEGHIIAILFFLKTQAQHRGYIETVQQNVTVREATEFSQAQLDAMVRGQIQDRPKYERMLDLPTDT